MKKIILIILVMGICVSVWAIDKGWNVAVDVNTGDIKEMSYGDSGYQHCIDANLVVVKVPSENLGIKEPKYLEWIDGNSNQKVEVGEIIEKSLEEINTIKRTEDTSKVRRRIVDLSIKRDKAQSLGYTDLKTELELEITEKQGELIS